MLLLLLLMSYTQPPPPGLPPAYPVPEVNTDRVQHAILEVRVAETQPRRGLLRAAVQSTDREIFLYDTPIVTTVDVMDAHVEETNKRFTVAITLTETGADALTRATAGQRGKLLAIILDGTIVSAPMISGPLGNRLVIARAPTRTDAERIAASLRRQ